MSVLSNTTIKAYISEGRIVIEPRPKLDEGDNSPYDACSVQLHIGDKIQVPKKGLKLAFDLSQPGTLKETIDAICDYITIPETGFVLEQGSFVLATTIERVHFPIKEEKGLAGRIEGRSSYARTGLLVHFTAPTIHAGFEGTITLELLNHGPMPLILKPGLAICQLIVETVRGTPKDHKISQFQNQNTPSGSNKPGEGRTE